MLTIENVETYGWAAAIRGMRNPKNSWDKMDSHPCLEADWSGDCAMVMNDDEPAKDCDPDKYHFCVGEMISSLCNRSPQPVRITESSCG